MRASIKSRPFLASTLLLLLPWQTWAQEVEPYPIPKPGLPLIVKGAVCETLGDIVIDTGSRFSTVSIEFKEQLTPLVSRNVLDGDGVVRQADLFIGASISFGKELFYDPVYSSDLSAVRMATGRNIRAILGSTSLVNTQIVMRQSRGELRISREDTPSFIKLKKNGIMMPMETAGHTPIVNLPFGGGHFSRTQISSGSDGGLTLHEPLYALLVKEGRVSVKGTYQVATASGFADVSYGRLDRFVFCGVVFENLLVSPMPECSKIGLDILSRFIWAIDFRNEKAYFQRDPDYQPPFDMKNDFGAALGYLPDGTAKVFQIVNNSPAAGAGLREGDIIKKINGLGTGALSKEAVMELLTANVGKELAVEYLRGGRPRVSRLRVPASK